MIITLTTNNILFRLNTINKTLVEKNPHLKLVNTQNMTKQISTKFFEEKKKMKCPELESKQLNELNSRWKR